MLTETNDELRRNLELAQKENKEDNHWVDNQHELIEKIKDKFLEDNCGEVHLSRALEEPQMACRPISFMKPALRPTISVCLKCSA